MKHLHWGIITDTADNTQAIFDALTSYDSSDVLATTHYSEGQPADIQPMLAAVNALYADTHDTWAMPLIVMALKRGIPVVLKDPVDYAYHDFIRLLRICEQTGTDCYVDWSSIDLGLINMLLHTQLHHTLANNGHSASLRLLCRYHATTSCWQHQALQQCFLLQALCGVIVDAVAIHAQHTQRQAGILQFENNMLCDALWMPCSTQHTPHTSLEAFTPDQHHTMCINNDGTTLINNQLHTTDSAAQHLPLLRQIVEALQGFNVCLSTVANAASCAWVVDRLCRQ